MQCHRNIQWQHFAVFPDQGCEKLSLERQHPIKTHCQNGVYQQPDSNVLNGSQSEINAHPQNGDRHSLNSSQTIVHHQLRRQFNQNMGNIQCNPEQLQHQRHQQLHQQQHQQHRQQQQRQQYHKLQDQCLEHNMSFLQNTLNQWSPQQRHGVNTAPQLQLFPVSNCQKAPPEAFWAQQQHQQQTQQRAMNTQQRQGFSDAANFSKSPVTQQPWQGFPAVTSHNVHSVMSSELSAHSAEFVSASFHNRDSRASLCTTQRIDQSLGKSPAENYCAQAYDMTPTCSVAFESQEAFTGIVISPTKSSEFDGYNRWRTPSGLLLCTASGQRVELYDGIHQGSKVQEIISDNMYDPPVNSRRQIQHQYNIAPRCTKMRSHSPAP